MVCHEKVSALEKLKFESVWQLAFGKGAHGGSKDSGES